MWQHGTRLLSWHVAADEEEEDADDLFKPPRALDDDCEAAAAACGGTLKEKLTQPGVAQHSAMQSATFAEAGSSSAAKSSPQRMSVGSSIDAAHTTPDAPRASNSSSESESASESKSEAEGAGGGGRPAGVRRDILAAPKKGRANLWPRIG